VYRTVSRSVPAPADRGDVGAEEEDLVGARHREETAVGRETHPDPRLVVAPFQIEKREFADLLGMPEPDGVVPRRGHEHAAVR
jgi:hypothetical protein